MPVAAAVAGRPRVPPQRASRRSVIASERQIRDGGAFDAVIDFDAAIRDPAHPSRMLPASTPAITRSRTMPATRSGASSSISACSASFGGGARRAV
jgi:hypothetical protein